MTQVIQKRKDSEHSTIKKSKKMCGERKEGDECFEGKTVWRHQADGPVQVQVQA